MIEVEALRAFITTYTPWGVASFGSEESRVTTCISGAWGRTLDVTGWRLIAMAMRLVVEVDDSVAAWKTAGGVLALHWGSLDGACCSVKPDETREFWLFPT
jgi:hypothetical protein